MIWSAFARWPGMAPLLMGAVFGADQWTAEQSAAATWPQVPAWEVRR